MNEISNDALEKEIVKSAKLLSSMMEATKSPNIPPIMTYKRHPELEAILTSKNNGQQLYNRFNALCEEYYLRYGRTHKYQTFDVNFEIGLYYWHEVSLR